MQRGLCWTHTERDVNEYVKLWAREIGAAHAIARKDWDEYWACLVHERLATQEDRSEFDRCSTDTHRQTASPRPGVRLSRRWPLGEAEAQDIRGRLDAQVCQALDTALEALGEPPFDHRERTAKP